MYTCFKIKCVIYFLTRADILQILKFHSREKHVVRVKFPSVPRVYDVNLEVTVNY